MRSDEMPPAPAGLPGDFWERARSADARILILDYDGTLAPFRVNRFEAVPLEGIVPLVERIAGSDTRVAVVSGRPIRELEDLIGDIGVSVSGSHGWEVREPDGSYRVNRPSDEQSHGLDLAVDAAEEMGFTDRIERKVASVALHTRGLPAGEARSIEKAVHDAWLAIGDPRDMACRRFNGGVELRATGMDKGTAVRTLLAGEPDGVFAVYIGDDDTDEDAFRELAGAGVGIKVGETDATAADATLPDIESVRDFLQQWSDRIGPGRHG